MKAYMPNIAGNRRLRSQLCEDILSGKLAHAYIIEGARGSGRHLFALSIAKALGCERKNEDRIPLPCECCASCKKISSGNSLDVITVSREPDKSSLGIEAARFIRGDVRIHPNDLDFKIYIIEDADKMTVQAQNALLLTLEEPPAYAIFLLLCEQSGALLETVRSRAPIIRTEPVDSKEIEEFLMNSAPENMSAEAMHLKSSAPSELAEIIMASGGAIGRVYELLDREKRISVMAMRARIRSFVYSSLERNKASEKLDAVFLLSSQKRETLAAELELTVTAIRDLIVLKKDEDAPLCFYSNRDEAIELSSKRSIVSLLRLISLCEDCADAIRKNANVKLTLTSLVSQM